jgi:dGTPase
LVGVTQVVSPSEGEIFHNRLTHTLKVAQVARRLAEMFLRTRRGQEHAEGWGRISPDVVEAASLAHDLGHPPFGHIAEDELNRLVSDVIGVDGYEGNAQSFRIITRLAVRQPDSRHGLDLTRATLDATLKYPFFATESLRKYGAYRDDDEAFRFAREGHPPNDTSKSIEAQIMDWADDITYSIHDTEDFYRAGLIPLDLLRASETERTRFLDRAIARRKSIDKPFSQQRSELEEVFLEFSRQLPTREPYTGTRSQRGSLAEFTSRMVSVYVQETRLLPAPGNNNKALDIPPDALTRVELCKELTWVYVIENPALAGHQHGQRMIIETLFDIFYEAARKRKWILFPPQFREEAEEALESQGHISPSSCARLVADTVASMTDQQARHLYRRLTGQSQGSVFDPIVR